MGLLEGYAPLSPEQMRQKVISNLKELGELYDFSLYPSGDYPKEIIDAEGELICVCENERAAFLISQIIDYVDELMNN